MCIKITQEEKEAFDKFIEFGDIESNFGYFLEYKPFVDDFKSLNRFTPLEFVQLLLGDYEVEEPPDAVTQYLLDTRGQVEFKEGDKYITFTDVEITVGQDQTQHMINLKRGLISHFYPVERRITR